jgi:hypothetical protein
MKKIIPIFIVLGICFIYNLAIVSHTASAALINVTGTVDISGYADGHVGSPDSFGPIDPGTVTLTTGDVVNFTYTFQDGQRLRLINDPGVFVYTPRITAWLGVSSSTFGDFSVSDWTLELIGATSGSGTVPTFFSGTSQGSCCAHIGTDAIFFLADSDFIEFSGVKTTFTVTSLPAESVTYNSVRTRFDADRTSVVPRVEVFIDIKPDSYPNSINPRSKGKIPVAILSSMDFDAPTEVDTESITFGPTGDEESLAFCSPSPEDINDDGYYDLICHFYTQHAEFECGDSEGILKGQTVDETSVEGSDSVRIVPSACR